MTIINLNYNYKKFPLYILPYVGSKRQYINNIPFGNTKKIKYYYEPFFGSGSILLNYLLIMDSVFIDCEFYVNDINKTVINFHKTIKNDITTFINYCKEIKQIFDNKTSQEQCEFFYEIRDLFNSHNLNDTTLESAVYYFLVKCSFKNLIRFNKNDDAMGCFDKRVTKFFNEIIENNLRYAHYLYKKYQVQFTNLDYKDFLDLFINNEYLNESYIICDSPYWVENGIHHFNDYNKEKFTNEEIISLYQRIIDYRCPQIIFNRNIQKLNDLFDSNQYTCKMLIANHKLKNLKEQENIWFNY